MWYEDLTECDYLGEEYAKILTAVGWLEDGKLHKTGNTPKGIVEKLYLFNKTLGMYVRFLGYHQCDFCGFLNVELGATILIIAYKNKTYVCPALIIHYIESHSYLPPSEFIEAILNYDHQYAMEYFKEIRENKIPKRK